MKLTWNGIRVLTDPSLKDGEWYMVSTPPGAVSNGTEVLTLDRLREAKRLLQASGHFPPGPLTCNECGGTMTNHANGCTWIDYIAAVAFPSSLEGESWGGVTIPNDVADFGHGVNPEPACECGSEKTFGPGAPHSGWCPKADRAG